MTRHLAILFLFVFLSLVHAHSYIICTDYKMGDKSCPDTHPYYPSAQHPKKADISHKVLGTFFKPVDDGQPGVFFSIDLASKMPSAHPGQKLNLVWPADNHATTFPPYTNHGDKNWDIWVTAETNPNDEIFNSPVYASLDYSNCFDKKGVDWTGQSRVVCNGEISVPKSSSGVTTFVMGWNLGRNKVTKYGYVSAFQYNVTGEAISPTEASSTSDSKLNNVALPQQNSDSSSTVQQGGSNAVAARPSGQGRKASCRFKQKLKAKQQNIKQKYGHHKDHGWGWNGQTTKS